MKRTRCWATLFSMAAIALLAAGCAGAPETDAAATDVPSARDATAVPTFEVDPSWPKELPNLWILGSVTGVFVDARDHVWITHLPETLTPEETSAVQEPPIGT